jgi:hypothetical protein
MPSFTTPPDNTSTAVEHVALHLLSSLLLQDRLLYCRPQVVEAEEAVRLAALGDALADLIRHLRTQTLLLWYKAKQTSGVQTGTCLHDSVASVGRCMDFAAAGY